MDVKVKVWGAAAGNQSEDEMGIRKGPWTVEEDTILADYIAAYGEGRWNSVARSTGLRRTGKSCRLRWLNYLRPNVRRGNITLQEQILILELHSRWGNRWSKIAQHLPGRTDNEIKNYWRTRVIKQAKQLKCDVNSKQFRDAMNYVWMPRLLERIRAQPDHQPTHPITSSGVLQQQGFSGAEWANPSCSSATLLDTSTDLQVSSNSDHSEFSELIGHLVSDSLENGSDKCPQDFISLNNQMLEQGYRLVGGDSLESLWNDENIWFLQQQLCDDL